MDECEKRKAFHLSSGVALQDEIADKILFVKDKNYANHFGKKGFSHVKNCFKPRLRRTILCHSWNFQQNVL